MAPFFFDAPARFGILAKFLEQAVDQPALQPAVMPPLDRLKGTELRWQIFPPRLRACHPKQRLDKTPIVRPRPALTFAAARYQRQNSGPLMIAQFVPIQNQPPKISFGIIILDQSHETIGQLSPRPREFYLLIDQSFGSSPEAPLLHTSNTVSSERDLGTWSRSLVAIASRSTWLVVAMHNVWPSINESFSR